jgi:hypothetical protein
LQKFGRSAQAATPALSNLARVAQDAPFGFIGIANNLDPLLASFSQLKRESGGVGGALKSLAAGLAGPAGLAVGLSVVTSGIVALTQKYGSLGAAFREFFVNISDAERVTQGIAKATTEAAGALGKERAELTALVSVANNDNVSRQGRNDAIRKLREQYPQYLGFLNEENLNTEKATQAIEKLNRVLLIRARIQGAEKFIADLESKRFDILTKPAEENLKAVDFIAAGLNQIFGKVKAANVGLANAIENRTAAALGTLDRQAQLAQDTLNQLNAELANLGGLGGKPVKPGGGSVQKQQFADFSKFIARDFVTALDESVDEQFRKINPFTPPVADRPFDAIDLITANLNLQEFNAAQERIRQFQEAQQKAIIERNRRNFEQLKAQQAEFTQILGQGLAQPLGDLIFNFLDKGKVGFKEFADAAINAIKRIVAQLVATKIIQLLASLTPFGQAQRLGSGLGNLLGSGFGFIGRTAAPSFGGGGLSGGVNLTGQVVFVQRGSDLVGVLSRSNNRINRVG